MHTPWACLSAVSGDAKYMAARRAKWPRGERFRRSLRAAHNPSALADRLSEVAVRLQALESTFRSFEAAVNARLVRLEARLAPLEALRRPPLPAPSAPPAATAPGTGVGRLVVLSLAELHALVQACRGIPPEVCVMQPASLPTLLQIHAPLLLALDELVLFDPYASPQIVRDAFCSLLAQLGANTRDLYRLSGASGFGEAATALLVDTLGAAVALHFCKTTRSNLKRKLAHLARRMPVCWRPPRRHADHAQSDVTDEVQLFAEPDGSWPSAPFMHVLQAAVTSLMPLAAPPLRLTPAFVAFAEHTVRNRSDSSSLTGVGGVCAAGPARRGATCSRGRGGAGCGCCATPGTQSIAGAHGACAGARLTQARTTRRPARHVVRPGRRARRHARLGRCPGRLHAWLDTVCDVVHGWHTAAPAALGRTATLRNVCRCLGLVCVLLGTSLLLLDLVHHLCADECMLRGMGRRPRRECADT